VEGFTGPEEKGEGGRWDWNWNKKKGREQEKRAHNTIRRPQQRSECRGDIQIKPKVSPSSSSPSS